MIYITYYNGLSLPDVSCYFQVEYLNGFSDRPVSAGDKVLFLMLKNKKDEGEVTAEDIYPIATRGTVESIDGEWALIHTTTRVSLDSVRVSGKIFELEMRVRPDIEDIDPEELKGRFQKMRSAMLNSMQENQQQMGMRNYIMRWRNMNELITFTSGLLQVSVSEKYAILEEDSVAKRTEMIEKAFYESLELYKVSSEAKTAQQQSNEELRKRASPYKSPSFRP